MALGPLAHHLQRRTACQRAPKWPTGSGHSKQLSLSKFFDPSTPSMRKVDDGEKEEEEKTNERIMLFIVASNFVASQSPECRPTGMPTARANYISVRQ